MNNLTIRKLFGMVASKPCVGKIDFPCLVNWPCMNVVDIKLWWFWVNLFLFPLMCLHALVTTFMFSIVTEFCHAASWFNFVFHVFIQNLSQLASINYDLLSKGFKDEHPTNPNAWLFCQSKARNGFLDLVELAYLWGLITVLLYTLYMYDLKTCMIFI